MPRAVPSERLFAEEPVVVLPGATVDASFTVTSAAAVVRLVDAAGVPVVGLAVYALQRDPEWLVRAPRPTNVDGRTKLDVLPVGRVELLVRHKDFARDSAVDLFVLYMNEHAGDAAAQQRAAVSLGTLDTRAGETCQAELVVPPDGIPAR